MPIRNRWISGDYLMRDDESGKIHYRSEMVRRWDGLFVRKDQYETRQPQEFVQARADPAALYDVRPDQAISEPCGDNIEFVGNTTIPVPRGAAWHLYDVGVGDMEIGCSWLIR